MSPLMHATGRTLIHFVWQGAVLAIVAAGALRLCRHRSANTRYAISCVVLAAMLASPVITAHVLLSPGSVLAPVVNLPQTIPVPRIVSTAAGSWNDNGSFSIHTWTGVDALLPVVVFVWLAGVTVLLVRLAGGLWHVRRVQVRSLAATASRWQAAAERIASCLGLRVAVHVVESAVVDTPTHQPPLAGYVR